MNGLVAWILLAAAPQQLTFEGARRLAEAHAPDVAVAQLRSGLSRADIAIAGTLANPAFTVNSASQSAKLGLALSVPLPLFGQRGTAIRAAEADHAVAKREVELAQRDARRAATVAWVDLWEAQARARLLAIAAADAQRVLEVAHEKFEAGIGAKVDWIRTRADQARAAAEAEAATHEVAAAAHRLGVALGLEEALSAAGEPAYGELPAELALRFEDHPALLRDRDAVTAAEAHVIAERRLRWPLINAQVGVNLFDPGYAGQQEYVAGLSFDLPVLNLRGGAIERARAQQLLSQALLTIEEQRLRSEASDAWQRALASASQRRALKDHVLPDLEETRSLTEEGYRLGRLELLRVLEAQKALLESRLAEAQALATWTRALADLERSANLNLEAGAAHAP